MISRRQFLGLVATGFTLPVFYRNYGLKHSFNVQNIVLTDEALRIHRNALVLDGHNDLLHQMRKKGYSSFENFDLKQNHPTLQTDIPRLLKGGVGAQFWVVNGWYPGKTSEDKSSSGFCLEDIGLIYKMTETYADIFALARSADDILKIHSEGKIASLIGIEGGNAIENSLNILDSFYRLGARYMTLAWGSTNDFVDSATDKAIHGGLTDFGKKLILEMNRIGMMVDISHISADSMRDVLQTSQSPVIASHSSAYSVANSPRNIPDDVLQRISENEGIVMVNFFPGFLTPEGARIDNEFWKYLHLIESDQSINVTEREKLLEKWDEEHPVPGCSVEILVDHIDQIVKIAGLDHVGLGSDFDGIPFGPEYLEDVSYFPYITQVLLNRGYDEKAINKILGGNFISVFKKVEKVAMALS